MILVALSEEEQSILTTMELQLRTSDPRLVKEFNAAAASKKARVPGASRRSYRTKLYLSMLAVGLFGLIGMLQLPLIFPVCALLVIIIAAAGLSASLTRRDHSKSDTSPQP